MTAVVLPGGIDRKGKAMASEAVVEAEVLFLGGDERAARDIVWENDGLHNKSEVVWKAVEARLKGSDAA